MKGGAHIKWTPALSAAFSDAKEVLKDPKCLTLPSPDDNLSITVDASPLNRGLGATMFVNRDGSQKIAEFFSFKLKEHQYKWLPCELEALAISSAATHFLLSLGSANPLHKSSQIASHVFRLGISFREACSLLQQEYQHF